MPCATCKRIRLPVFCKLTVFIAEMQNLPAEVFFAMHSFLKSVWWLILQRMFRKRNPPNFLRKSMAHCYPSTRNDEERHHARGLHGFAASGSWNNDPRVPASNNGGEDKNATVYAAILGNRTYKEEDELLIDFDELGSPHPVNRVSAAFYNACGCLLG